MARKRCIVCAEADCDELECVLVPEMTPLDGEKIRQAILSLPTGGREISLGTTCGKPDIFDDLAPADLWLQGWRPEDDSAFNLEFQVRGSDVVG